MYVVNKLFYVVNTLIGLIPLAAPSKVWVFYCSLAELVCSNPTGGMAVYFEFFVLSGRILCVGPIALPEESYSVCVYVSLSVVTCSYDPLHLQ